MNGTLTPLQRFFLAFVAFFFVLFDRRFAEAVQRVRDQQRALPPGPTPVPEVGVKRGATLQPPPPTEVRTVPPPPGAGPRPEPTASGAAPARAPATAPVVVPAPPPVPARVATPIPAPAPVAPVSPPAPAPDVVALHVLSLLQRDGRLVDFLSEDLNGFSDSEIGAAARTVHEGCRKTLAYVELEPIYRDAEGASVTVATGFDPTTVRVTGNVVGDPPFRGSLRHHGWRALRASFPPIPPGHDPHVLAPAEVEL